jgi:hypothetical protein
VKLLASVVLIRLLFFHYKLRVGLGMDRAENTASNCSSIVTCVFVAAGTCLLIRCLATVSLLAPLLGLSGVVSHCSVLKAAQQSMRL